MWATIPILLSRCSVIGFGFETIFSAAAASTSCRHLVPCAVFSVACGGPPCGGGGFGHENIIVWGVLSDCGAVTRADNECEQHPDPCHPASWLLSPQILHLLSPSNKELQAVRCRVGAVRPRPGDESCCSPLIVPLCSHVGRTYF